MRSILVPVDFSDGSLTALKAADRMADAFGAELVVLHVTSRATGEAEATLDPSAASLVVGSLGKAELVEDVREAMSVFLARAPEPKHPRRVLFRAGPPAKAIAKTAEDARAALIVMATYGRQGLARLVLGSTAEEVVRTSLVPVLTIKPEASLDL